MLTAFRGVRVAVRRAMFVLALPLVPVWLVLLVEYVNRGMLREAGRWIYDFFPPFLLNYGIVLGLWLAAAALTGGLPGAFLLLTLLLLLPSILSRVQYQLLGTPVFPWEIVYGKEWLSLPRHLGEIRPQLWGGILFFVLVGTAVSFLGRRRMRVRFRTFCALLGIGLLAALYRDEPFPLQKWLKISTIPWDQAESYAHNGYLLSTLLNTAFLKVDKPADYGKESVLRAAAGLAGPSSAGASPADGTRPNVIVILSESFWDPTVMDKVRFSRDPLPFLHSLQQSFPSGWLLSPQLGGGTANVEFEVLTGNSMRFLPDWSLAYISYVNRGVDSLAGIFSRQGYTATAINPFYNWFFNSRSVYRDLGFGRFISSEFFPPVFKGPYLADSEVADMIIRESEKSDGPDFIFANTMENHHPYDPGKFAENTITVEGDLSERSKGILETYAQGISDADKMLKTLVEHYSRTREPTILVFFGDHLPSLGENDEVYVDAGYITGRNDPDYLEKMYRTPVVIWSNELPLRKDSLYLSPSFLGPWLLHETGLPGSAYTDFLYGLYRQIPVIPPRSEWEAMNIRESDLADYRLLQYDILFGRQYLYGPLKNAIIHPDFRLGYGPMTIVSAAADVPTDPAARENGAKARLTVRVNNASPEGTLLADGEALETRYESGGVYSADVPPVLYEGKKTLTVQVKVIDAKQVTIAETAPYPLELSGF